MKGQSVLPYRLRSMAWEDLDQVAQIEREAFPTLWPPTSYKRELKNRLAHYVVCIHSGKRALFPTQPRTDLVGRLLRRVRRGPAPPPPGEPPELVVGFVGLWFMADEAHIVSIAVQEAYRGQGLGELLLLGAVELALQKEGRVVTLEARITNILAQSLYQKYGFHEAGVRRSYYSDNREDAMIMTTDFIGSAEYQDRIASLRQRFEDRYGEAQRSYS